MWTKRASISLNHIYVLTFSLSHLYNKANLKTFLVLNLVSSTFFDVQMVLSTQIIGINPHNINNAFQCI